MGSYVVRVVRDGKDRYVTKAESDSGDPMQVFELGCITDAKRFTDKFEAALVACMISWEPNVDRATVHRICDDCGDPMEIVTVSTNYPPVRTKHWQCVQCEPFWGSRQKACPVNSKS